MGSASSSLEETDRERERRSGDMTKAEVLRIKTFFRVLMVYKIEWVHAVSGRVHHNTKMQRLRWSLSKLDLRENQLKYFPPQVQRLKRLRELDLSKNRFKRFPADAFRAPNLEVVKISDNKIRNIRLESLTPSLLSNLVELHLNDNRIAELPDAFIDFCNLEVLNLSANVSLALSLARARSLSVCGRAHVCTRSSAVFPPRRVSHCTELRSGFPGLPGADLRDDLAAPAINGAERDVVSPADVQSAGKFGGARAEREQFRDDAACALRYGPARRRACRHTDRHTERHI